MPGIPAIQEAEAGELLDQEAEAAGSQDCATALQPEWQSVTLSQKESKQERKILHSSQHQCLAQSKYF